MGQRLDAFELIQQRLMAQMMARQTEYNDVNTAQQQALRPRGQSLPPLPPPPPPTHTVFDKNRQCVGLHAALLGDRSEFGADYDAKQGEQRNRWQAYVDMYGWGMSMVKTGGLRTFVHNGIPDDLRGMGIDYLALIFSFFL